MLKPLIAAAAIACSAGAVHAVEVRPLVGFGLTAGGDKLAEAPVSGGFASPDSLEVHAGGLVAFVGGLQFKFDERMSAQATIAYHVDRAAADNGEFSFERFPVELLAHYRVDGPVRIGGGLRLGGSAKFRASGAGAYWATNEDFKAKPGFVVEGEYLFAGDALGVKLRFVSETYESKTFPQLPDVDGSHVGVFLTYYFR